MIHFDPAGIPILMIEFNNEGPRLSDLEFYLRKIAKENDIAKYFKSSLHLKIAYDQLDKEMRNIFAFTVKVKSVYTNRVSWIRTLEKLNDEIGYKDVRLELFFKRNVDAKGKYDHNIKGTDFVRTLIGWLKKSDRENIKYLDDLKMTYQDEDDRIIELDFLKNKDVSIIRVPRTEGKSFDQNDLRNALDQEFTNYLTTGKTNSDT